jgi:hypothetical protein
MLTSLASNLASFDRLTLATARCHLADRHFGARRFQAGMCMEISGIEQQ